MDGTLGQVNMWVANFAPRQWAFCYGQTVAISDYTALFSVIGTYYGGDGRTTFKVPDLRSRAAVGAGSGPGLTPYQLGTYYGFEHITLTEGQLPSHLHNNTITAAASPVVVNVAIPAVNDTPNTGKVNNTCNLAKPSTQIYNNSTDPAGNTLKPFAADGSVDPQVSINNARTGSGQAVENRQPFCTVNYVICMTGLYPSRN